MASEVRLLEHCDGRRQERPGSIHATFSPGAAEARATVTIPARRSDGEPVVVARSAGAVVGDQHARPGCAR